MTTAVDTCVLLDMLLDEPGRGDRARDALRRAFAKGRLIVGEVVYAELRPQFRDAAELGDILEQLGITYVPSSAAAAAAAGAAWGDYRRRGGPRERLIGDFLVGAHALVNADVLLTRDTAFYKQFLEGLTVVEP